MTNATPNVPGTWRVVNAADIADPEPRSIAIGPFGSRMKADLYVPVGVPVVRGNNITNSRTPTGDFVYVPEETARSMPGCLLYPGDLVFPHRGAIGEVGLIGESIEPPLMLSTSLMKLTPDKRRADPLFLYYYFHSDLGRRQLLMRASTVGTPGIGQPLTSLRSIPVPLPPLAEQRGIAATLGALDDKIESNRRLVSLIPQFIRAQVDDLAAVDGRDIPVSVLARFVNGGAYTKGASGTGRMVLRIAELNGEPGASTVYSEIEVPEDQTARAGDVLMSWSGSLGVYRWFRDEAVINQHIFKVIPTGYPAWLVFDRLDAVMPVFRGVAQDKATTMGHIQRGHLDSTSVAVPTTEVIERLSPQLDPLWDRLLLAERENVKLATLRDALLPELLSGRIRVPEAAEAVATTTA